jgi:hypothetical protein
MPVTGEKSGLMSVCLRCDTRARHAVRIDDFRMDLVGRCQNRFDGWSPNQRVVMGLGCAGVKRVNAHQRGKINAL